MESLYESIEEYRKQIEKGAINKAYKVLGVNLDGSPGII